MNESTEYPTQAAAGAPPAAIPIVMEKRTNGLAIASLITAVAGVSFLPFGVVGLILGLIALRQIRESPQTQDGYGIAVAGVAIGAFWTAVLVFVIFVVAAVVFGLLAVAGVAVLSTL
jgi:uncharacterized membrane protein